MYQHLRKTFRRFSPPSWHRQRRPPTCTNTYVKLSGGFLLRLGTGRDDHQHESPKLVILVHILVLYFNCGRQEKIFLLLNVIWYSLFVVVERNMVEFFLCVFYQTDTSRKKEFPRNEKYGETIWKPQIDRVHVISCLWKPWFPVVSTEFPVWKPNGNKWKPSVSCWFPIGVLSKETWLLVKYGLSI